MTWILIAFLLLVPARGPAVDPMEPDELDSYSEIVRFQWHLEGFSRGVLSVFPLAPTKGTGVLEARNIGSDQRDYRFRASFLNSPDEHFWIFRSIVDRDPIRSLYVQDLRRFRGKQKVREQDLSSITAIDVVAGLHLIRVLRPETNMRAQGWADGKFYPIEIVPGPRETREINGEPQEVEQYQIRGVKEKGQPFWKPIADIWLMSDDVGIPVEILYQRGWAKVRLVQESAPEN